MFFLRYGIAILNCLWTYLLMCRGKQETEEYQIFSHHSASDWLEHLFFLYIYISSVDFCLFGLKCECRYNIICEFAQCWIVTLHLVRDLYFILLKHLYEGEEGILLYFGFYFWNNEEFLMFFFRYFFPKH